MVSPTLSFHYSDSLGLVCIMRTFHIDCVILITIHIHSFHIDCNVYHISYTVNVYHISYTVNVYHISYTNSLLPGWIPHNVFDLVSP